MMTSERRVIILQTRPGRLRFERNGESRHRCEHNNRIALIYLKFLAHFLPLRREGRSVPAALYARVPPFAVCIGTRDRGCSKHPVFPAPSDWRGQEVISQTSGAMRRENSKPYPASLRAQRSNPPLHLRHHGLLRYARNDDQAAPVPTSPRG